jgi:hypothetical protein
MEDSVVKSIDILLKDNLIRNLMKKTASKSDKKINVLYPKVCLF